MTRFEPIAIVGQGCVLPGAHSVDELWNIVEQKKIVTQRVQPERLGLADRGKANPCWFSGLVNENTSSLTAELSGIDPVCRWPILAVQDAWSKVKSDHIAPEKRGVILANLLYPSRAKAEYAADIWRYGHTDRPVTDTLNSGYPAHLIARQINAKGPVFALDAACASSLYALEIACRKLANGQIDIAAVAGVSAADNLILHIGFSALKALSPTGRSRPFIQGADGLVPSEGAAAVILKRLSDVAPGEKVFGLIRSIGLSNDGRRKGLLAPDADGQIEAMQRAYAHADIHPDTIGFLECHATGTPVGDGVEVGSAARVFGDRHLPAGSLKANTGHLITVAGLASLLKLTAAMERETLPAMPLDGELISPIEKSGLTPLSEAEHWKRGDTPRRAAISNFGFGGNNSHLILEQYEPSTSYVTGTRLNVPNQDDIVVCGIGVLGGPDRGERAVLRRLMNAPIQKSNSVISVGIDPVRSKTPPADLLRAEPQQLAILEVTTSALEGVQKPEPEKCGVFTGVRCANDSARWLLRERVASYGKASDEELEAIAPALVAADVLGAMANMNANRLTVSEDFRGRGFALAAAASSGLAALDAAMDALQDRELDLAVVAAADFATEQVAAFDTTEDAADLAAALVLKRRSDAEAAGDQIFGSVSDLQWGTPPSDEKTITQGAYGNATASDALFEISIRLLMASRGLSPQTNVAACALTETVPVFEVTSRSNHAQTGAKAIITPAPTRPSPDMLRSTPYLYWAAAGSPSALGKKLETGKSGGRGKYRIALLAEDKEKILALQNSAISSLLSNTAPEGAGIFYRTGKPEGELAFAFTGSAASYPRMGRGFLSAFPEVSAQLAEIEAARAMTPLLAKASLTEFEQLCAVSLLTQAHSIFFRDILELQPDAALGLSLGESNALFAFGYWKDMGGLLKDISDAAMYERHLGGDFETAKQAWGPNVPTDWANWRLRAPIEKVRSAVSAHTDVEITIIYSDQDSMIGGPADACRSVAESLGKGAGTLMHQHLIVHANAMRPFSEKWRELHTRPVSRIENGPRLYANAINAAYKPTKSKVAQMLTEQAVTTVDFPKTVRQAWEDGVRTFVEIGPRDSLTQGIRMTLAGKPHLAIATDEVESSDLTQIARMTATLFAEGYPVRIDRIAERLDTARANPWRSPPALPLSRPAKYAPPKLAAINSIPPENFGDKAVFPTAPPFPSYTLAHVEAGESTTSPLKFPPAPYTQDFSTPASSTTPPESVLSGLTPLTPRKPTGKSWGRQAIEAASRGSMADFFGDAFREQDQYARNVRLPAPPLLLVDRITGIDAEPLVSGKGVIWTETNLKPDHWMMQNGRVRPGPLIECGQADLTLIGWMGADLQNKDERVYRLLGCEITFHEGGLPQANDTLKFQIEITQHATFGGVRMFFFQYDCHAGTRPAFSVRQGQAGFFTDQELASGKGVSWSPEQDKPPTSNATPADISRTSLKTSFSHEDVAAFRRGDAFKCFGARFEHCAAHSFPPHLPEGKLSFFHEVSSFDPVGGPWKRGYLQARAKAPRDAWFYEGHFHNDPCMPGTLMAEAAVQALEFYAAALGLTQERDGYVFEPVPGETAKFICRGQVIPDTDHEITYEVFVDEVIEGETPKVFAALLAKSDGKKVFYCPRFGVQLRRNWPEPRISHSPIRTGPEQESRGDYAALLDCANGAPSSAFGEMYRQFDTEGKVPRLPQPPYHMMSRVVAATDRPGIRRVGASISAEYDIPADAWYFEDNANGEMPFAVLSEIVLQPCGWLASHCGFALDGGDRFRNLEGDGHVYRTIKPGDGTICVDTQLSAFSKVGPMTIVAFDLKARLKTGEPVMDLSTRFGFFPAAALVRQAGLAVRSEDKSYLALAPISHDLSSGLPEPATEKLRMLDRVDYFNPHGGKEGLGLARARQSIDPYAWYFKAHFFGDPVQPGSLGLDALVQLLIHTARMKGLIGGQAGTHVETLAADMPVKWSYRGQVTPEKKEVTTVMEIISIASVEGKRIITGRGSLWCDGLRIYEANPISIALMS